MATSQSKKDMKKYHRATVASFEKEYGINLHVNKQMHLSKHIENSGLPNLGKLLRAVENNLAK